MSITEVLKVVGEIKNAPINDERAKLEAIVHTLCVSGYVDDSLSLETKLCAAEVFSLYC